MNICGEIDRTNDILKQGWVIKKSKFLKVWRHRLLVLSHTAVSTFKSSPDQKPTMHIPLSTIKQVLLSNFQDREFRIQTDKQTFSIQTQNNIDMCEWCNSINQLLKQQSPTQIYPQIGFQQEEQEKKLIHQFNQMKSILIKNEQELLYHFQKMFQQKLKQSKKQVELFNKRLIQQEKIQSQIDSIRSFESSPLQKMKYFSDMKLSLLKSEDNQEVNEDKIVVSVNKQTLESLITSNIKPQIINPKQIQVRRTNITRALKWRHTGKKLDALTFSVNTSVNLTAVGICRPFRKNRNCSLKSFKVLKGPNTHSKVVYCHNQKLQIQFSHQDSTYKIELKNPIVLEKGRKYSVVFSMSGSHTFKCVDCNSKVKGVVNWSFYNTVFTKPELNNRCDVMCGPIADFYYTPLSQ